MSLSYLWDEYVLYKNIKVYPFLMEDYEAFEELMPLLLFEKNQITNPEIIKMSYLRFLLLMIPQMVQSREEEKYKHTDVLLNTLFRYVFKDNDVYITIENNKLRLNFAEKLSDKIDKLKQDVQVLKSAKLILSLFDLLEESDYQNINTFYDKMSDIISDKLKSCDSKSIRYKDLCEFWDMIVRMMNNYNVIKLKEKDFDNLKKIILEYNAVQVPDENLHPKLRQKIQEAMQLMAKRQKYKEGTMEEQIISYKTEMRLSSYEPIKNMTIYQFRKELQRLDLIKDYQIYKTAEMSGMVTFKQPIPHWRSHVSNKPDYSSVLMDKRQFDNMTNKMGISKK